MKKDYVEKREDGYWVADTRVSLDSLVYDFNRGATPESIRQSFSVLTLEEVYGALTFYLANQAMIDTFLAESEIQFEKEAAVRREEFKLAKPELYDRLKNAEVLAR